jgi:hypothetical protein
VRAGAAALLALFLSYCPFARAADVPVDLELVLAVDVSGSIDWEEASLQRRGYVEGIMSDEVIGAIRSGAYGRIAVAYIEWAGAYLQRTVINWTVIGDAARHRHIGRWPQQRRCADRRRETRRDRGRHHQQGPSDRQ